MLTVALLCVYYLLGYAVWKVLVQRQFRLEPRHEQAQAWLLTVLFWPLVVALDIAIYMANFIREEW